ncbi:carbon-nitrogen hydrolase family protein [Desulfotomaculum copahuensis]|uniref:CN hydrolase domain-containing protein n=1 Tax=Desulfotomaculum copahuensis TaxID=1838280 RepID=A0A1B7LG06_9FIRM|nr:carbon-nitrogen hydrolase family protein [Desulfotomaculum copahuensis]OAT83616.1 hypothetical protein A6M21_08000 [Desulfotomaculum copahuensis]
MPRVAVVQVNYYPALEESLQQGRRLLAEHLDREGPVDLAVFPDHWIHPDGWSAGEINRCVQPVPGELTVEIGRMARDFNLHIAFSMFERGEEGCFTWLGRSLSYRVYKSCLLIGPGGEIAGVHRKTHYSICECPGSHYEVFATSFGRVALLSCGEASVPEVVRIYGLLNADFLVWLSTSFETELNPRVVDTATALRNPDFCLEEDDWRRLFLSGQRILQNFNERRWAECMTLIACANVIYANNAGVEPFMMSGHVLRYTGNSAVVPLGLPAVEAGGQETVVSCRLDNLEESREIRELILRDRRPDTYQFLGRHPGWLAAGPGLEDMLASNWQRRGGKRQLSR